MFRTNTWIREQRGHTVTPAPADEIVLDFLRQTELQAVPVSAGSRTFLFSPMGCEATPAAVLTGRSSASR